MAVEILKAHMGEFTGEDRDALIFTGAKGKHLRASTFSPAVKWPTTVTALGLPGFHFPDLRHTGNTLAAASGASTRELMKRLGQSTMRAALIYQHATSERDREIASDMDKRIAKQVPKKRKSAPDSRPGDGPPEASSRTQWPTDGPQDLIAPDKRPAQVGECDP